MLASLCMGCGASKAAPFDWAHEAGDIPAPVPLHRTISGSPTTQQPVVATEERREKLPSKLIRTNTQALIGDEN